MSDHVIPSHLAASPQEYERLGIKKGQVEPWEDGIRTGGGKGTYEWWYFDAHLSDGSKTVIVFYTKPLVDVGGPLAPYVAFTLDGPDGSHLEKEYHAPAQSFSSAKETCDVRIGPNTFKGDLHNYAIHVEIDDLRCDVTLSSTTPPWRPETGYLLFGERSEHFFAWLPSVPQGDVQATLTVAGSYADTDGSRVPRPQLGEYLSRELDESLVLGKRQDRRLYAYCLAYHRRKEIWLQDFPGLHACPQRQHPGR